MRLLGSWIILHITLSTAGAAGCATGAACAAASNIETTIIVSPSVHSDRPAFGGRLRYAAKGSNLNGWPQKSYQRQFPGGVINPCAEFTIVPDRPLVRLFLELRSSSWTSRSICSHSEFLRQTRSGMRLLGSCISLHMTLSSAGVADCETGKDCADTSSIDNSNIEGPPNPKTLTQIGVGVKESNLAEAPASRSTRQSVS